MGLAFGTGYEFPVGERWGLGPAIRFMTVLDARDDFNEDSKSVAAAMLSATYL